MATKKKMLQAAAGSATGGAGLDIDEVFSTYLYDGTGAAQTITNGIDLDGEGGLVWLKTRSNSYDNWLYDTVRGNTVRLISNSTAAQGSTGANGITSFNSDGFGLGAPFGEINGSGSTYASWTFRKAPKFFDVVTYTGTQVAGLAISHNLGSVPGTIIVKRTDGTNSWTVYHRSLGNNKKLELNKTDSIVDIGNSSAWNTTTPTDTQFFLGADGAVNANGGTYVAYLFAHNDGDGEFGPDSDQDIIKCGSLTTDSSGYATADLGFEPQFVLVKSSTRSEDWNLLDTMRGFGATGLSPKRIKANNSSTEDTLGADYFIVDATSLKINAWMTNQTYIYMAIRRGPLAEPEDATEVFAIDTRTGNQPSYVAPFEPDMAIRRNVTIALNNSIAARLTGTGELTTNDTAAESSDGGFLWDYMDGWANDGSANSNTYSWMWKRAPGFFDVVAYSGNSTAGRTVSHNLGVAPEMIWVKVRNLSSGWPVWHTGKELYLNLTAAKEANPLSFNNTDPTDTSFTLNSYNSVNGSGYNYIAYLFASLPGISKVGSYTGNGSSQNIDCGFTSGARFVLIKRTNDIGSWWVFDTERGIVAGDDKYLKLNDTSAEGTAQAVDPYSGGFGVNTSGLSSINGNGDTFIFYAIA